ncbi:hypothetical protein AZE42_09466 [Rhizopogon vesiculosus]|uniref:Uncharacterized protein n=1 Tax=Rhizopogon vesiculosus TaxID=180088 RepID=A0A1J8R2X7_9AGAM|nr:hypothetical protein AZE42_09466 [Rhizopogon vesiculosus]
MSTDDVAVLLSSESMHMTETIPQLVKITVSDDLNQPALGSEDPFWGLSTVGILATPACLFQVLGSLPSIWQVTRIYLTPEGMMPLKRGFPSLLFRGPHS